MLNNTKLGLGLMVFVVILLIVAATRMREDYGVFSHRGALHGIKNLVPNHYSLRELRYRNPIDYWNYTYDCAGCKKRSLGNMSVYDRDLQSYHAKRFDPETTM